MTELPGFFTPQGIAVIGASARPAKVGNVLVRNILESGFIKEQIYPVNPVEKEILGLACFPRVSAIRGPVDLAVIAVPASAVPEVLNDCGQAGIRYLVVITAGFKEAGREGLERERQLVATARSLGIRVVGPNCVGIIDTHTPLNASWAQSFPQPGKIAFISQSGALLLAILDWSLATGLGFSRFVSLGNKADLDETDFIAGCGADPFTSVILCYLEDVVRGQRFLQVAREVSRQKPIIVYKSGTSQAGARAASSHTGALAGSDVAYETAFRQSGIIRARDLSELFDLALAFSSQPLPRGPRVAIITMAGGLGIITTDNVERSGLEMASLTKETIENLKAKLPPESGLYNPVDVLGDAPPERLEYALDQVLADHNVDAVITICCPTGVTDLDGMAGIIIRCWSREKEKGLESAKPLFACFTGGQMVEQAKNKLAAAGIPAFTFPEPTVAALAGMVRQARLANKRQERTPRFTDIDHQAVKAIFYDVLRDHRLVLLPSEASLVADAYGIPVAPTRLATNPKEATSLAEKMGYPVVLKIASPEIMHKTDVGGVKAGLGTAEEVTRSFRDILENVEHFLPKVPIYGIEVQKMMPPGVEVILGLTRDKQFGPLLAFGLGGIYVNLIKDVSFRLARHLSRSEVEEMIAETRAYTLLRGYRGGKPADIPALAEAVLRLGQLSQDFPEIAEVDINPVIAYSEGLSALDIKITISQQDLISDREART